MRNSETFSRLDRDERWTDAVDKARTHPNGGGGEDEHGYTALHWACNYDPPVELISTIIAANPNAVIIQGRGGYTPLHFACMCSSAAVITRLLKENIAPVNLADNRGQTPIQLLCCIYNHSINSALKTTLLPHHSPSTLLHEDNRLKEFYDKAIILVKAAYYQSVDSPLLDSKYQRILHAFIGTNNLPSNVIQLLLKIHPKQIEEADENGNLPLHIAAAAPVSPRKKDIIRSLIDAYPTAAEIRNEEGHLPLHLACLATFDKPGGANIEEDINILIRAYPDAAAIPYQNGKLPLHLVCDNRCWESGVETVFTANPMAIEERDNATKLFPFMSAAVGESQSLMSIYCLLRENPAVIGYTKF